MNRSSSVGADPHRFHRKLTVSTSSRGLPVRRRLFLAAVCIRFFLFISSAAADMEPGEVARKTCNFANLERSLRIEDIHGESLCYYLDCKYVLHSPRLQIYDTPAQCRLIPLNFRLICSDARSNATNFGERLFMELQVGKTSPVTLGEIRTSRAFKIGEEHRFLGVFYSLLSSHYHCTHCFQLHSYSKPLHYHILDIASTFFPSLL